MVLRKTSAAAAKPKGEQQVRVEDETDVKRIKKVDPSIKTAIQKRRCALKLTQAKLAAAINERQQVVADYESGRAIPDSRILNKIIKVLGPLK